MDLRNGHASRNERHPRRTAWATLAAAGLLGASAGAIAISAEAPQPLRRTAGAENAEAIGVGRIVPDMVFRGLDGEPTTLSAALKGKRGVVLCLTSITCPLSIKYGPRLARFAAEAQASGFEFYMVNVADTDSLPDMRRQVRTLGWKGGYLPDRDRAVRRAVAARTTTEVLVIDAGRTLVYRGAVDDQYGVGTSLDRPRNEYLRDAMDAVLKGRAPRVRATWAPGCVLAPEAPVPAAPAGITYHNRISRIIQERCLDCHSQERAAPFSLAGYEALVGRAPMVEAVVRDGIMPPWHADPSQSGQWANERALSESERADLLAWLASADRPAGDPADGPVHREFPAGWLMGIPDQIFMSPTLELPAEGPMVYAEFRMDLAACEGTWLSAVEMLPRRRDSVHHAIVYLLPPASVGEGSAPERTEPQLLAIYGPGFSLVEYPANAAVRIPAGSSLLMHVYALPMGVPHRANLRVGLRFAKSPPAWEVRSAAATSPDLRIPPHTHNHEVVAEAQAPPGARLLAFIPSMRTRGHAIRYDAVLPGGEEIRLLDVPHYDYKWRIRYELAEPLVLPAGARVRCTAVFDNSASNPNNADPDREVRAGWTPEEDMLLGGFEYLIPVR